MFVTLPPQRRAFVVGIQARLNGLVAVVDMDTLAVAHLDWLTANPLQLIHLVAETAPELVMVEDGPLTALVIRVMEATSTPVAVATAPKRRRLSRPA